MRNVLDITIDHADRLHQAVSLPVLTAAIRDDENGGAEIFFGFADLDPIQAQRIAVALLKDLLALIVAENHPCPSREERMERLTAGLAALEGHQEPLAASPEARH